MPAWLDREPREFEVARPLLASWVKRAHPEQVALRDYRASLASRILPLPSSSSPPFLHFEVAVRNERHLLEDHDLENYLTPLFGSQCLDPSRFALVTARKTVGDRSAIRIGVVEEEVDEDNHVWNACPPVLLTAGLADSRERKEELRAHLGNRGVFLSTFHSGPAARANGAFAPAGVS